MKKPDNLSRQLLPFRQIALSLSLAAALPAHGLGLGELALSSHLGQPLNAHIRLLEAPADLTADCFKIQPLDSTPFAASSDFRLILERKGSEARLRLTTRQAIHEPAVIIAVAAQCEDRIRREYAILLDPPQLSPASPVIAEGTVTASVVSQPEAAPEKRPAHTAARAKLRPSPRAAMSNGMKKTRRASHTSQAVTDEGPRLVLSGGRRAYAGDSAHLALNLDVGVLDTARKAETPLNPVELTDENTALSRKVEHLEQMLTRLQKRNAELETARANMQQAAAMHATPEKNGGTPQWPYFMLGFALLTGGAAYVLYRRRQNTAAVWQDTPADWTPPESPLSMAPAESEVVAAPVIKAPRSDQGLSIPIEAVDNAKAGTEVKDSVADEVEVFVAHGHADLAVHLLEDHIRNAPEESPVPWLLLLDLLKREGIEDKYETVRQDCKQYFNVSMPAYNDVEAQPTGQGLESYPHILSELVRLWPTEQANGYLDDLIYDRRGGSRMGFDPITYRDIVLLRSIRAGSAWTALA